jgi:lambda family phage tail tape measure protein
MNMQALLRIRADVQGENNIRRLGNSLQGVQGQVKNLALGFAGLRAAVGGMVGLVGGGLIVTKIFGDTATLEAQARSLQVLTGSATQASQIIRELQSYGALTPFESTDLIETAKRLNAFGVDAERVVDVTKQLGDVAGATGANLGELATAYGQVVAKGRLQGEELLQFQERGVALSAELQKMYNLQGQEFTKALEGGRISAAAVEVAIQRLTMAGGKYANGAIAQSDTLSGKFSTLKDNITALSQTIGNVLAPAIKAVLDLATNVIDTINQAINTVVNGPQQAAAVAAVRAGKLPFGGPEAVDRIIGEDRRRQIQQQSRPGFLGFGFDQNDFVRRLQQQPEFSPTGGKRSSVVPATPPLLPPRASGSSGAEAAAKRAAAERKRIAEALAGSRELLAQSRAELAILREADPIRKIQLEYEEKRRAVQAAASVELSRALSVEQEANIQRKRSVDLQKLDVEEKKALKDAYKELGDAAYEAALKMQVWGSAAEATQTVMAGFRDGISGYLESIGTLGEGISALTQNAFKGLEDAIVSLTTTGTFSFRQFALSVVEEMTRMVTRLLIIAPILQAIQSLIPGGGIGASFPSGAGLLSKGKLFSGGIFGNGAAFDRAGLQAFAMGGVVSRPTIFPFANGGAGRLGLMGEAGPEAIIPLKRGADGKLGVAGGGGTSVTVNVDAKGTSVQGDSGRGEQLARVVAQAVQAELIKQKRPGGLMAA